MIAKQCPFSNKHFYLAINLLKKFDSINICQLLEFLLEKNQIP